MVSVFPPSTHSRNIPQFNSGEEQGAGQLFQPEAQNARRGSMDLLPSSNIYFKQFQSWSRNIQNHLKARYYVK